MMNKRTQTALNWLNKSLEARNKSLEWFRDNPEEQSDALIQCISSSTSQRRKALTRKELRYRIRNLDKHFGTNFLNSIKISNCIDDLDRKSIVEENIDDSSSSSAGLVRRQKKPEAISDASSVGSPIIMAKKFGTEVNKNLSAENLKSSNKRGLETAREEISFSELSGCSL